MLRILLFTISITGLLFQGTSQENISTTGTYAVGSNGSLSWTIGELVTETVTGTANKLTQGFQQDYENYVEISEIYQNNQFVIYPNPFIGELTFKSDIEESNYHIFIRDAQLKLVYKVDLFLPQGISFYSLDLSMLSNGLYFITVEIGDSGFPITKQIIKLDETH